MQYNNTRCTDILSNKESKIVYSILQQYSFQVISLVKIRGSYKVETSEGSVCLKKVSRCKHNPTKVNILRQELLERGFDKVAKYYTTIDGRSHVRHKKQLFYVTEWIDGEEYNLDSIDHAIHAVKLLAEFHLAAANIDTHRFKIKNKLKNWVKIFDENIRDIEKYERIINNKKIKSEFDISYYNNIEAMYHRGMVALNFLNTYDYYKLSRYACKNKTLGYRGFCYQGIIKKEDKYYMKDLDSVTIDIHLNDLGNLIRRLMYKRSYKWDFNKAKILIEAYSSINKLDKNELGVMLALIIFPHKFWKLGKKRYVKHKDWDESKYMYKLTRLTRYTSMQNKFLEDYLRYVNCQVNIEDEGLLASLS